MIKLLLYRLAVLFVFLLSGCGGSIDGLQSKIPESVDLRQSCNFIGKVRWFPSLDVFCSFDDFRLAYPNADLNNKSLYFRMHDRDILIAPFIGSSFIDSSGRISSKEELRSIFFDLVRARNYNARTDVYKKISEACDPNTVMMTVQTQYTGLQRLYEFCSNYHPKKNLIAIYLEGHGASALDVGVGHMNFLASQGFRVFYADLPLTGTNHNGLYLAHHDLGLFEQENGFVSPLFSEFIYPVGRFIEYLSGNYSENSVSLVGRSGGGWRSYVAGAIYEVDHVISIAGGTPHSMRLSAPWSVYELGDWEQWSPSLYSIVGHEDFMRFAGLKGSAYIFNLLDPCCFRLSNSDLFFKWLKGIRPSFINVYVDEFNVDHSLGRNGEDFLKNIFINWGI
jgi:hypothetical protein